MKRRHLLVAPAVLLATPVVSAVERRVLVIAATDLTDAVEIVSYSNPAIHLKSWVKDSETLDRFGDALRRSLNEDVIVLTSINITCHYQSLQGKVVSLPGATSAELEAARKSLESGSGVDWPTRDCECGDRHYARKKPVLVLYTETRWSARGLTEEQYRTVRLQLRELRADPTYRLVVDFEVINHVPAFEGRV